MPRYVGSVLALLLAVTSLQAKKASAVVGLKQPEPVDCEVSAWITTDPCDDPKAKQTWTRTVVTQQANGGKDCPELRKESLCLPVECELGEWSEWSGCLEDGSKIRTRAVLSQPELGGEGCPQALDRVLCDPDDCRVTPWSEPECNIATGREIRKRSVVRDKLRAGNDCPNLEDVIGTCDSTISTKRGLTTVDMLSEQTVVGKPVNCVLSAWSSYTSCSDDDGDNKWTQNRTKTIVTDGKNGGTLCPSAISAARLETRPCTAIACKLSSWSSYSNCADDDGDGVFYQVRVKTVVTEAKYGGTVCPDAASLARLEPKLCPAVNCKLSAWGGYTSCTDNGNEWTQNRTKTVIVAASNGGTCPDETDPDRLEIKVCPPVDCKLSTWSEYSTCSIDVDNQWTQTRIKTIATEAAHGGTCPDANDPERLESEVCPPVDCTLSEWGEYGICTDSDKNNEWTQTRTKDVFEEAKYGGLCPNETDSERLEIAVCPPVDCMLTDWNVFGQCTDDDKDGEWTQSRTRDVLVNAEFGGSCPNATDSERLEIAVCPAADCVLSNWSVYGACADDDENDEWTQSRTKSVIKNATYGGFCPSATDGERLETIVCPAVDCVLTDWSEFSNCTDEDQDNKWTQSRSKSVVSNAVYGGTACPMSTDPERLDTTICPPRDCVLSAWSDWTVCEDVDMDGMWTQNQTRTINAPARYGGTCPQTIEVDVQCRSCVLDGCTPGAKNYEDCRQKLAQCSAQEEGFDYPKNDIAVLTGLELWQCCDKCATTPGCKLYSFSSGSLPTKCYLKRAKGTRVASPRVISAEVRSPRPSSCAFEYGIEYTGSYVRDTSGAYVTMSTSSPEECCEKCAVTIDCKSFSMSSGRCFLKTGREKRTTNVAFTSGYLTCQRDCTLEAWRPSSVCEYVPSVNRWTRNLTRAISKEAQCGGMQCAPPNDPTRFKREECFPGCEDATLATYDACRMTMEKFKDLRNTHDSGVKYTKLSSNRMQQWECAKLCIESNSCASYVFDRETSLCYVPGGGDAPSSNSLTASKLNPVCSEEGGIDYTGAEISWAPGSSADECCRQCSRINSCVAYTLTNWKTCIFRISRGTSVSSSGRVQSSGVMSWK